MGLRGHKSQGQSKMGGPFVMMLMKGELEDHELTRPLISEAGTWVFKFRQPSSDNPVDNLKHARTVFMLWELFAHRVWVGGGC